MWKLDLMATNGLPHLFYTPRKNSIRLSVYALCADVKVKDIFCLRLILIVSKLPKHDQLVILSDFNERVGADHDSRIFCFGKMNLNGQRLLEFFHVQNLFVTTSFFKTKPQ